MSSQFHEFSYFYIENDHLMMVDSCSEVPEKIEDFCKLHEAFAYVQKIGCCGWSQHRIRNNFHHLSLTVLRWAVQNLGEAYPKVYRGTRSERPDSEHLILFGTRNLAVAKFYGNNVKVYENVRGIISLSQAKSVLTDDYTESDEEIIFFPDIMPCQK